LRLKGNGAKVEAQIAVQKEEIIDLQTGGDHIIAQGESLHQIANLYRVTLSDLIRLNNIEDPSRIMPGTKLAIPGKSSLNGSVSTASNVKVVAIQNKIAKNNANPVSTVVSVVEAPAVVPVQQDPVAASIRERWPKSELLNPFDLVATHKVMPNFVEPNQDHLSLVTNDITKSYDFSVKILGQGIARITVEIDETPGHLAEWAGVGLTAIRRLNGLGLKNSINVGEKLDLPLNEKSLVAFNTKRLEYHLSLEEDFFANYRVTGVRTHIVKRGDILTALLMREQIPVWLYRKYQKDTTSEKIFVGQELSIPLVESISTQTNFMEQNFNPSDIGEDENRATP
jgi:membrane-bound lytic murein transglycosylase D